MSRKNRGVGPAVATLLLIVVAIAASVITYSWVMEIVVRMDSQVPNDIVIVNGNSDSTRLYIGDTIVIEGRPSNIAKDSSSLFDTGFGMLIREGGWSMARNVTWEVRENYNVGWIIYYWSE